MKKSVKKPAARFILFLNTFLVIAIILEFTISKIAPQKTYSTTLPKGKGCFQKSQTTVFNLKPNCAMPMVDFDSGADFTARINKYGLRGDDFEKEKKTDEKRIIISGDSFILGFGVKDGQVVTEKLAQLLKESSNDFSYHGAKVINAGYAGGFGPDGYFLHLKNDGMKFQPDLIIFSIFVFNDFSDIDDDEWIGTGKWGQPQKMQSRKVVVDENGYLISKDIDLVYKIPILKNSHAAVFLNRAVESGKSKLKHYWERVYFKVFPPQIPSGEATDSNLPGAYKSACVFGDFCHRKGLHLYTDLMITINAANELIKDTYPDGRPHFLVLLIPVEFQIYPEKISKYQDTGIPLDIGTNPDPNPQKRLKKMLDDEKIAYLDLLPVMKAQKERTYFENDGHWNNHGHAVAAQAIFKWMSENIK